MHVSGHFKHFALLANASTTPRATRKKPVNPEEVAPVKSRFSEDEQQEERRQQQSWLSKSLQRQDEEVAAETAEPFEETPSPQSSGAAASAVQAASLQVRSPLDSLLAGIMSETPTSSEPPASSEHYETASLDDLLALMRAAPEKP